MRLLVTGALGFAGRYLLPAATSRGHEVIGSGLPTESPPSSLEMNAYIASDITNAESVRSLIDEANPDGIIHLAGQSSGSRAFQNPVEAFEANATGTIHLLEAARKKGVEGNIIVVTSSEAYGRIALGRPVDESSPLRPVSPYGASKAAADSIAQLYFKAYGLGAIRARAFSHTGPGQTPVFVASSWAEQIARAECQGEKSGPHILKVGNLDPVRDLGDVRDVIQAYLDLLERGRPGEAYNICTERGVKLRDLIGMFKKLTSKEIKVEDDPGRLRPTDISYLVGSAKKIQRELGWSAQISLDDTLAALLDDWRTRVGAPKPATESA